MKHFKYLILGCSMAALWSCTEKPSHKPHEVKIVGQMKNVMRKGQLHANINLDTIADKSHLYGLGPLALMPMFLTES